MRENHETDAYQHEIIPLNHINRIYLPFLLPPTAVRELIRNDYPDSTTGYKTKGNYAREGNETVLGGITRYF